jgi:LacI family transcriptional regulator
MKTKKVIRTLTAANLPLPLALPTHLTQAPARRVLLMMGWYSIAIHRGVARYAKQAGWALDAASVRNANATPAWEPDGVIAMLGPNAEIATLVASFKLPTINIGYQNISPAPRVANDNQAIAALAVQHFVERGFNHLAFYFKGVSKCELERLECFQAACRDAKRTFHLIDAHAGLPKGCPPAELFAALRKNLARLPKPLAVTAENDDLAAEVIFASQEERLLVPEQVAVLGVMNDELRCNFTTVPLSSIDDNAEGMGFTAAELLDQLMAGKKIAKGPIRVPPVGVVTRQSTDILAIENTDVAMALKTIWTRYREPINVEEVANGVPISYRRLHDLFVEHVGRSMSDEIARLRVEHAARELAETDKKVHAIAVASGFADANRMVKVFRRIKGMTPGQFRAYSRRRGGS